MSTKMEAAQNSRTYRDVARDLFGALMLRVEFDFLLSLVYVSTCVATKEIGSF
jgi:hypothetical protein